MTLQEFKKIKFGYGMEFKARMYTSQEYKWYDLEKVDFDSGSLESGILRFGFPQIDEVRIKTTGEWGNFPDFQDVEG